MKTILLDAWKTFVTEEGVFEELHQMLEEFPNPKIIVTNANEEEKIKLGIVDMPYEVYSLSHNPNKDDPEYFKQLFKDKNLSADQVVYFEHNADAVKAAKSLGIISFHYDKDKRDVDAVKRFLIDNI